MYSLLISQLWKKNIRGGYFKQKLGVKILLAFTILYFGVAFGLLGYFMPEILGEAFNEPKLISPYFMGLVLYYIMADIGIRFFMQDLNALTIKHYLCQPIPRKKVIHLLLGGSVLNFFNFFPLLFIIPFLFRSVVPEYGWLNGVSWLIGMLSLVFISHYLAIYLKRALAVKPIILIVALLILGGLGFADYAEVFSLFEVSKTALSVLLTTPGLGLAFTALLFLVYRLNYSFLEQQIYVDNWKVKATEVKEGQFDFVANKGMTGMMLANELKLVFRNKRTKSILMMSLFFSFYGLIFYTNESFTGATRYLFAGIFMTGSFMINYGQFLVAWESAYFDGILTRNYPMGAYFKSKLILFTFTGVVCYILTIPYIYFGTEILYMHTAAFLYNIGINSMVLIFASTYNYKRIDLSQGSAFNYQGTSAVQFVIVLPLLILPILLFKGVEIIWGQNVGFIVLGSVGLLGLASSPYLIKEITKNFYEKKYKMAAGYRAKD